MAHYLQVWRRPGHPNFGRLIDDPPAREATWHDGMDSIGDGSMQMPESFDRFDDLLLINRSNLANSVSSLVRIWSDIDPMNPGQPSEWLVTGLDPTSAKNDPFIDVSGRGIKWLLSYARVEPFDWDGSDEFTPTFPDWVWGGDNILGNPGFEDQGADPRVYWLLIDATAGTFTLSDGTDTTTALDFDTYDGAIEGALEADIAAIDDVSVTPLDGAPTGYELLISAMGGDFTITDGTDTTAAIAFNASAATIENRIETDLTSISDVTVTAITDGFQIDLVTPVTAALSLDATGLTDGSATLGVSRAEDGFQIEFVTPPTDITLTVDDSGLTGDATLHLVNEGTLLPSAWTRSQQISIGTPREFGVYDTFEPSMDQAHSGDWSLFIDPGAVNSRIDAFAGTQQVVNVEPGGLYQASAWVFPTASGQTYRLVMRGVDEDLIARVDVSPPANVWTEVVINDITIPDGDDRIIFRFANTQLTGDPAGFYVDDAALNEGQAADTAGKILGDLYDDATTDHAGRIVWEDEANPGTAYLTLDVTDTLDSAGNPWDRDDLSFKAWQRMDYLHVMESLREDFGYEWRIVPDDPEAGTWLWQVYNPEGMDDSPDVAILGGASDTRRRLRRFLPSTHQMVEGELRITARAGNAGLESGIGRIESSRLGRNLPDPNAVQEAAQEDAADAVIGSTPWSYELVNPQDEPGTAYRLGDTIFVHDPPEADGPARLWDWVLTMGPERETTEVQLLEEPT